jgi:hypothetical protein
MEETQKALIKIHIIKGIIYIYIYMFICVYT